MNHQDQKFLENICRVFSILPESKREYLIGVADGMAAMSATAGRENTGIRRDQPSQEQLSAAV